MRVSVGGHPGEGREGRVKAGDQEEAGRMPKRGGEIPSKDLIKTGTEKFPKRRHHHRCRRTSPGTMPTVTALSMRMRPKPFPDPAKVDRRARRRIKAEVFRRGR